MKIFTKLGAYCLLLLLGALHVQSQCPNILWEDNFTGNSLDLTKWSYQTGDGCGTPSTCGWGNGELQVYETANVTVSNDLLKITADREQLKGRRYRYTSGRIRSINKGDWTYGRFEASIKLPQGGGLWPAFWMLSTNEPYGGWPQSGEIDIMEFVGNDPDHVLGTIHYGDPYPNNQQQGTDFPFYDPNFLNGFHEYAIEWNPNEIKWFVDGNLFLTKTAADLGSFQWPFDQDMHFLLNVAVGGNLGGTVDDSIFPAAMEVDYVRVYDGGRPFLSGDRYVEYQGTHIYTIGNVSGGTNVSWSVPAGATIVSGQGSTTITVDWGTTSGPISAQFNTSCGSETLVMNTEMAPAYVREFSFENFDDPANATYASSDGTLTEVTNPNPNAVNSSVLSGEYVRNASAQFDNLNYSTSSIPDAAPYVFGDKRFYMDVLTAAPVGTEILIQLETPLADPNNYPDGRHSRYVGVVSETNSWHRVYFDFLDRPDFGAAPDNAVTNLLVLFNSNTQTGDTYYFDNLDSYAVDTGGPTNTPPSVAITSPANNSTFDQGTSITITADASDTDGSVSQVEFFVDGTSIGVDASSPYSMNWTIGLGTYALTCVATDNESASTTSSTVNVTGQSVGEATELYVSSIVTGTQGAGQGNKNGTATVTILDNNGNPVANALVSGTFSGTFNEASSGTTSSNGSVTLVTNGAAKGSVTVNLCVDNVTHGTLTYNSGLNVITCTGSGARVTGEAVAEEPLSEALQFGIKAYPNPFNDQLKVEITVEEDRPFSAKIYGLDGRVMARLEQPILAKGRHTIAINLVDKESGFYYLEMQLGERKEIIRLVKQ